MEEVIALIEDMSAQIESREPPTIDKLASLFQLLQSKYPEEYQLHQLTDLVVALVFPIVCVDYSFLFITYDIYVRLYIVMQSIFLLVKQTTVCIPILEYEL